MRSYSIHCSHDQVFHSIEDGSRQVCFLFSSVVKVLTASSRRTANAKAMSFVQILIISVTLVVVAVPEGTCTRDLNARI
jgi:hypothetical protein